ncbi:RNA polymerase sigma factor [Gynurincola endophyticus]|uniref:RNA polymerase sigma factor n=1 Tax=Gynurincola endophyticus TaxID=2479004 RepID=UPI00131559CE|nr:RNA polymerase sigma-70 factor [Gynurincola endophyticus]
MGSNRAYIDEELLLQIADGSETAFRDLYEFYRHKVYYVALKMLRSETDAKDALQDVFLRIWQNRTRLVEIENFSGYLNVLIRNYIYDKFRKKMNEDKYLQQLLPSGWLGENDQLFDEIKYRQLLEKVFLAAKKLPPQQRRVFELSRIEGLKHEAIATELGIAKDTVKKHLMAALRQLRSMLDPNGEW